MRVRLLRSFLWVFGFWWSATALWWSVTDPRINLEAVRRIAELLPFLGIAVPEKAGVTALDALGLQVIVVRTWVIPVLLLAAISALVGATIVGLAAYRKAQARLRREEGRGEFRGITISLGVMPTAPVLPRAPLDVDSAGRKALERLDRDERSLLMEILETLASHPDAYCGAGHGVSLLEHTANVLEKLFERPNVPRMAACLAAAQDLGRITAFEKNKESGQWVQRKNIGRESARHLALMSSWWALPPDDRFALLLAVKYSQDVQKLPNPTRDGRIFQMSKRLLDAVVQVGNEVTRTEKQRVLDKHDLPRLVFGAFRDSLPHLPFYIPGSPKGIKAAGFKQGNRLYLLEIQVRERTLARIDLDVREALKTASAGKLKLAPFTSELLLGLDREGWLVKEIGKLKLSPKEALWKVRSGKNEYTGVIIVDVPEDALSLLPAEDTRFEIQVLSPHFEQPGGTVVSATDLTGILAAPKKKPNAPESGTPTTAATKTGESESAD